MIVETVNAGGKRRPFLFSGGAMLTYEKEYRQNFNAAWYGALQKVVSIGESGDVVINMAGFSILDFSQFFYAGFVWGAKKQGVEFTETVEDVADWLTESPEIIGTLIDSINGALSYLSDQTDKKKATTPKRKPPTKKA